MKRTPSQRRAFRASRRVAIGDLVRWPGRTYMLGRVIAFPTYSEAMVTIKADPSYPAAPRAGGVFDTPWESLEVVPE